MTISGVCRTVGRAEMCVGGAKERFWLSSVMGYLSFCRVIRRVRSFSEGGTTRNPKHRIRLWQTDPEPEIHSPVRIFHIVKERKERAVFTLIIHSG